MALKDEVNRVEILGDVSNNKYIAGKYSIDIRVNPTLFFYTKL